MKIQHVLQRARERYGLDLSAADLQDMRIAICTGGSVLMEVQASGREVHLVQVGGVAMKAVFDRAGHHIVTVLPRHARARRPGLRKLKGVRR